MIFTVGVLFSFSFHFFISFPPFPLHSSPHPSLTFALFHFKVLNRSSWSAEEVLAMVEVAGRRDPTSSPARPALSPTGYHSILFISLIFYQVQTISLYLSIFHMSLSHYLLFYFLYSTFAVKMSFTPWTDVDEHRRFSFVDSFRKHYFRSFMCWVLRNVW